MPYFTSPLDGARLFYRDYTPDEALAFRHQDATATPTAGGNRPGPTLVFLHGWPMSSAMFEHLLVPLCETHRLRCVAPDRRGFGRSDWAGGCGSTSAGGGSGVTPMAVSFDTFVADVVALLERLGVGELVLVGASMGAQEAVLVYLASPLVRERCKGSIFMGANMPYPLQCPESPLSPSREVSDAILAGLRADRAGFARASLPGVFALSPSPTPSADGPVLVDAHGRPHASAAALERFEHIVAAADGLAIERTALICRGRAVAAELALIGAAEGEGREGEGKKKKIPMLLLHGDRDQGMPLEAGPRLVRELVPWAEVRVYEDAGHGLYLTHAEQVIDDIVAFVNKIAAPVSASH